MAHNVAHQAGAASGAGASGAGNAEDIDAVVRAAKAMRVNGKFHKDGLYFDMDEENIFISGHSAGAHVVVANLLSHCGKIKGQILMSPVDGYDPFGLIDDFVID